MRGQLGVCACVYISLSIQQKFKKTSIKKKKNKKKIKKDTYKR